MKVSSIFLGLAVAIASGCNSDSAIQINNVGSAQGTSELETLPGDSDQAIVAMFNGASFASVNQLEGGENADGDTMLSNWWVSFTADTVTFVHRNVVEIGSYSRGEGSAMLAQFPGREVAFEANGSDLLWDSVSYLRTAKSQFDSQVGLVTYFDGARYDTVDQFDIGETATGELAMSNWSVQFSGDEVSWAVQDTIAVGSHTYISDSKFRISLFNQKVNVVVLDGGNLLIDSKIYEKKIVSQFNSQETLVGFLSAGSYKSVGLKSITGVSEQGAMGMGLGYWFVDFLDNTMTWAYRGVSEVGTIEYLNDDSFTAVFPETSYTVTVENDDIIFDGTRYSRVIGE